MNEVYRKEKKFLISLDEYIKKRHMLSQVLKPDAHSAADGYMIRTLYFDTVFDEDFDDKLAGIETRRKIRLRIYDTESDFAMLEMKQKQGDSQLKRLRFAYQKQMLSGFRAGTIHRCLDTGMSLRQSATAL